ncbi:MAG: hypothetical protein B6I38_00830 [Anaerolineaceae bacterium 4572_5.1]|nr:MAG: hypothetical protein B6I38_00830 [Anaerolineaceae bacterium 4572_5.1]RLD09286.1 MAG: hypothetical protein DRI56_04450 [Chloroflexota bacterium]
MTLKRFLNSKMIRKIRNNQIVRKSIALGKQFPRLGKQISSKKEDYLRFPPVLANSFPKSGTHLLLQIVEAFPKVVNYGTFIASMPSVTFKERSRKAHLRLLSSIVPGEVIPAHLFYQSDHERLLSEKNCVHFFIYRDPRDVVVSEAHYLAKMNRWHRMHPYFKSLNNLNEQISMSILGVNQSHFPYDYPDVAKRFSRYNKWFQSSKVFTIRYEDLISPGRRKFLREMVIFYAERSSVNVEIESVVAAMERNITPEKSHTFRQGGAGAWKTAFTDDHKLQMKQVAGNLLIELGYERDKYW